MSKKFQESPTVIWWIVGIIIIALMALLALIFKDDFLISRKTNREVALTCTTDMATQFHIHPKLKIVINGQDQGIPAEVGIVNGCMNALHTHEDDGTLHVESPQKRDFQLSDFFAVWGKTYNKNQILDFKVDDTHFISQTVNGKETQDYENTVLKDLDEIIIYYEVKK